MSTEEYVHQLNVLNFTRQLAESRHASQRELLMTLLANEQASAIIKGWIPILHPDAGKIPCGPDMPGRRILMERTTPSPVVTVSIRP